MAPRIVLRHHKHCARIYQGALPSSRLRYLNNAVSLQIYKKYDWQRANVALAICTARVEGRRAEARALLHALHHYALRAKVILADFDLAVLTPTAKPPNLIPCQIFRLYGIQEGLGRWSKHTHQSESHQSATTMLACRVRTQDASHTPSPSFLHPPHPHIYLSHEEHNQYNGQQQVVPSCLEVPVVSCHADSPMGLLLGN